MSADDVDESTSSGSRVEGKLFKLNGTNFGEWKAETMAELQEKGHWPQIEDEVELKSNKEPANVKAKGFIIRRIAFDLQHLIPKDASAGTAWRAICNRYEKIGAAEKIRLLSSLFSNKLGPGEKVDPWLHSIRQNLQRLAVVETVFDDKTQAAIILALLPPDWSTLVTALSAHSKPDETVTVARVTIELQEEEKRREEAAKTTLMSTSALLAHTKSAANVAKVVELPRDTCTWCLKPGHRENDCYSKRDGKPRNIVPQPPRARGRGPRRSANVVGEENSSPQAHVFMITDSTDTTHSQLHMQIRPTDAALNIKHSTEISKTGTNTDWYVDSGATDHYCSNKELFTTFTPVVAFVTMGDGYNLEAEGTGDVTIKILINDDSKTYLPVTFTKVMYVPGLAVNLLSVSRMDDTGLTVSFNQGKCLIQSRRANGEVIGTALKVDSSKLWRLATAECTGEIRSREAENARCNAVGTELNENLAVVWHRRLAHLHFKAVHHLFDQNMVADSNSLATRPKPAASHNPDPDCQSCILGKLHRTPVPHAADHRATEPLYRVHIDVCGPFSVQSHLGQSYFLQIVDDYSRYIWARAMRTKDQAFNFFKEYVAMCEAMHGGRRVSIMRSDNGGEFMSNVFSEWLAAKGIRRERTNAHSPWQNGVVERMNRTVVEAARTILVESKLPTFLWSLACHAAVYIRNRSPTASLPTMTPYEAWHGEKPFIGHMRIFGCLAYKLIRKTERGKFEPAAEACTFVGYSPDSTAYRLWDGRKVIESRDVHFVENKLGIDGDRVSNQTSNTSQQSTSSQQPNSLPALDADPIPAAAVLNLPADPPVAAGAGSPVPLASAASEAVQPKRPIPRMLSGLKDRLQSGPRDPAPSTVSYFALAVFFGIAKSTMDTTTLDPRSYYEAMASPLRKSWQAAMDLEMASLEKAGTYTLTSLPANRQAIGCKWVYKTKRGADGQITKHKARLVAKGYAQRYGVDYEETYAPVARYTSIRALLALAAHHNWELHQMDVKSAYLNGDLEEDIYMQQPEGYEQIGGNQQQLVCKLIKSLYGLKQAGRTWHLKIDIVLKREGFRALDADHCMYIRQLTDLSSLCIIALYVDDLLIACNDLPALTQLKADLIAQFEMEDLGEAVFILGIEIKRDRAIRTLSIGQSAYISSLLERHGMINCKPVSVPMNRKNSNQLVKSPAGYLATDESIREYQAIIGGIMFAMLCTRPDIAFAVITLAQFSSNPSPVHVIALNRLLCYLRGTIKQTITYTGIGDPQSDPTLAGYCDADWGEDRNDRRSVTGYVFLLAGGAISWQSKKQKTVALSSTEAEYMAAAQSTKEALWWRSTIQGLGYSIDQPTPLYCDNQGAIALAKNPEHHNRTKHIDIQYHFIRERVADHSVRLVFVGSEDMIADALTKALDPQPYSKILKKLGMEGI
jgi:transposase InsO family protein